MFNSTMAAGPTVDRLESALVMAEAEVSRWRSRQLVLLAALEDAGVAALDGARTMTEWAAARLDVTGESAEVLVRTARAAGSDPGVAAGVVAELGAGEVSFDRAAATMELAAAGADAVTVADSRGLDLAGVVRLTARHRRVTAVGERRSFADRYVVLQPSLDEGLWRLHGRLPGYEGHLVAAAVAERGDRLHTGELSVGGRSSPPQRAADALVAMAQDSLDGDPENADTAGRAPLVSVFVDAALAAPTGGEAGVVMASGSRVGPETLERMLCEGRVEVNTTGACPLGIGPASRVVPPRLRRSLLHRDGGCVVDGCRSRYRLQAHHVTPVAEGGRTDADNLIALCWYHHHVVVHGQGHRIDPASPPRRIRFLRPNQERSPP